MCTMLVIVKQLLLFLPRNTSKFIMEGSFSDLNTIDMSLIENKNENQHTSTDDNASRNIRSYMENGGLSPLQSTIANFPSNSQSNTTLPNNLFDEFLNLIRLKGILNQSQSASQSSFDQAASNMNQAHPHASASSPVLVCICQFICTCQQTTHVWECRSRIANMHR